MLEPQETFELVLVCPLGFGMLGRQRRFAVHKPRGETLCPRAGRHRDDREAVLLERSDDARSVPTLDRGRIDPRASSTPVHDDLELVARAHGRREASNEHAGLERMARDDAQAPRRYGFTGRGAGVVWLPEISSVHSRHGQTRHIHIATTRNLTTFLCIARGGVLCAQFAPDDRFRSLVKTAPKSAATLSLLREVLATFLVDRRRKVNANDVMDFYSPPILLARV